MSISSEIKRITNNVQATLTTIAETGVEVGSTSDDLPTAALSLANEKANKTGWTPNKYIGSDENGNLETKEPPENGSDGVTPHIGENGNWFIGDTDTGKPSQGANGASGVYYGSGEPPADATVQIDPDGDKVVVYDPVAKTAAMTQEVGVDENGRLFTAPSVGEGTGSNGTTFIPSVDENGNLTWTNDGGLQNPETVNIKGAAGQSAYEAALEGGYTGTESEFNEDLAAVSSNGTVYSTSEVKTPDIWIDGKPIYQKVVSGKPGNVIGVALTLNIGETYDKIVDAYGIMSTGNVLARLPYVTDDSDSVGMWVDYGRAVFYTRTDRSAMTFYAIFRYTK